MFGWGKWLQETVQQLKRNKAQVRMWDGLWPLDREPAGGADLHFATALARLLQDKGQIPLQKVKELLNAQGIHRPDFLVEAELRFLGQQELIREEGSQVRLTQRTRARTEDLY